ncbi:hypothetical protein QR680_009824 [Steinernema hermaphroditum]|uniref:Piwi domain-containing protein n=1 Tax=Steinernema hermaphroditum TaxID=289476 RepID=A0AA39M9K7_9BILA|nr:hypothetical protein QR680_009824 [Steinernema hermaphroditum]
MKKLTQSVEEMKLPVSMAPKVPGKPATGDRPVKLKTNMFSLEMTKQIPVYMYHVDIHMKCGSKLVSLVKKSGSDHIAVDNKGKCRVAFRLAFRKFPNVFPRTGGIYYDLQAQLYTVEKLKSDGTAELNDMKELVLDRADLSNVGVTAFGRHVESVIVQVKPIGANFQLTLGSLHELLDFENPSHELLQFLDVATSQHAYQTPKQFITFSSGFAFCSPAQKDRIQTLDGGKQLLDGFQKSVKIIEGNSKVGKKGELAIVVDPKKVAFHEANISFAVKVEKMGFSREDGTVDHRKIEELSKQLKGVFAETHYSGKVRWFEVHGVVKEDAQNLTFDVNGRSITVETYYKEKYNIRLQLPKAPLIRIKGRRAEGGQRDFIYLPMELAFVCANQRATIKQQTPKQISDMIRSCAMLPAKRAEEVKALGAQLQLNGPVHRSLQAAHVEVDSSLMTVEGRTLAPPEIGYKGARRSVDANTGKWKSSGRDRTQYLVAANINSWELTLLCMGRPRPIDDQLAKDFSTEMVKECRARGMQINGPSTVQAVQYGLQELEGIFSNASKNKVEFLLFVQDSRLSGHKQIKFLERKYRIVTQDVDRRTVQNVVEKRKFQTLENIVAKTNMKLGGVNYTIFPKDSTIFRKGRLLLGFQVSHPPAVSSEEMAKGLKPSMPTVIGVAGNVTKEPCAFVGDIYYQEPREDRMVDAMDQLVTEFAKRYIAVAGVLEELIIYRNGATDSQYANLLRTEVAIIKQALKKAGAPGAKITLIVVSKQHNTRIMPAVISGEKAPDQNVKPGTVVDAKIVHPLFQEFYLNSHQTLQGSARTPKYTIIKDESVFTLSQLEQLTNILCYGHQIINLPTSLPAPVYIAGRYAERGAMLLQASRDNIDDVTDFKQLNANLAYRGTKLEKSRVNA